MLVKRMLVLAGLLLMGGCLWPVHERTQMSINDLATHPFDVLPDSTHSGATENERPEEKDTPTPEPKNEKLPTPKEVGPPMDLETTRYMQGDIEEKRLKQREEFAKRLNIPGTIPGEGAEAIKVLPPPDQKEERKKAIQKLYPDLGALPREATPLTGPNGRPYTLADLQQVALENSPTVRQAYADTQTALGNWIQAQTYPNPTFGYEADTAGTVRGPGYQGVALNQTIKMGGKLKLLTAAAEMDLRNAELALKRARFDLATQVRSAYYAHLVAREVMRVNKGLAEFTDEVYRIQVELLLAGYAAPYEPASLRAQAYSARMNYNQAIIGYNFTWTQLVAAVNLKQLPLTEVAGRVDLRIPKFDYLAARDWIIQHHTDLQTARNSVEKARYQVKYNQVIPAFPDANLNLVVQKDYTSPQSVVNNNILLTIPIPIWDQNRGNILAAQATLERASYEPGRVQLNLLNQLATNFQLYEQSLVAIEVYRAHILPDQVRAYRGIFQRRALDMNVAFADLVNAQQTLALFVANYLTVLNQVWSSAIAVADLLQTDDLFQLAKPLEVPGLPVLETVPQIPRPLPPHQKGHFLQTQATTPAAAGQGPTLPEQKPAGVQLPAIGQQPSLVPSRLSGEITRSIPLPPVDTKGTASPDSTSNWALEPPPTLPPH
jgi:cobalt-zinc-cadmium efflux system outer membrane protein